MYKIIDKCPRYDFLSGETDIDRIDEIINNINNFTYDKICDIVDVSKDKNLMLVGKNAVVSVKTNGDVEIFNKFNVSTKITKVDYSAKIMKTPMEIQDQRFSICLECHHFIDGKCADVMVGDVLEKGCDCYIDSKVAIPISVCPINKWGPYHE